jgi:hypothetical protein
MTKTPTAVYTCHLPEQIDAYEAHTTELWEQYQAKIKTLQEEWGTEQLLCSSGRRGQFITGYVAETRTEAPMPGFRREAHSDYMKPALRTKAGKEIAARLKDVAYEPPKKPGLPDMVLGEGFMGGFSIRKMGGVWYAWCTVPLPEGEERQRSLREVDPGLWTPAKLSEYFLAVEAEEAATKASA